MSDNARDKVAAKLRLMGMQVSSVDMGYIAGDVQRNMLYILNEKGSKIATYEKAELMQLRYGGYIVLSIKDSILVVYSIKNEKECLRLSLNTKKLKDDKAFTDAKYDGIEQSHHIGCVIVFSSDAYVINKEGVVIGHIEKLDEHLKGKSRFSDKVRRGMHVVSNEDRDFIIIKEKITPLKRDGSGLLCQCLYTGYVTDIRSLLVKEKCREGSIDILCRVPATVKGDSQDSNETIKYVMCTYNYEHDCVYRKNNPCADLIDANSNVVSNMEQSQCYTAVLMRYNRYFRPDVLGLLIEEVAVFFDARCNYNVRADITKIGYENALYHIDTMDHKGNSMFLLYDPRRGKAICIDDIRSTRSNNSNISLGYLTYEITVLNFKLYKNSISQTLTNEYLITDREAEHNFSVLLRTILLRDGEILEYNPNMVNVHSRNTINSHVKTCILKYCDDGIWRIYEDYEMSREIDLWQYLDAI